MKLHRSFLFALVAMLPATLQLTAQPSGTVAFNHLEKADALIGMVITDSHNQHAGKVSDLAIDWQAGRIAEVLVDTGGFLTTKQRIVAVPPESFVPAESDQELRMNADLDAFDNAPAFDMAAWNDLTIASSVRDVYARFHVQPYRPVGSLVRTGKILGLVIRNQQNQRLAKVESLVVDLPGGRMRVVIISSTGFLGMKDELSAVPPEAFYFDPEYDALVLATSKEALKNAPHFKPGDWRNAVNESMSLSAIDDSLKVLHSLTADGMVDTVPDGQNPRIAIQAGEGDTQRDAIIIMEIEHKILATDGLSMDARHVLVTARTGHVTLHGLADSDREKQQLGNIAASVVPADHVDNQIEVRVFANATIQ
jgi:sporulation protein YlmC with PRC-barrel domain